MVGDVQVRYLTPSEYDLWDRFVDESPQGSIYSQSYFLEEFCKAKGGQFRILAVYKHDELLGGVGLYYRKSRYGDRIFLQAPLYYNGFILKRFDSKYPSINSSREAEVIRAILSELEGGTYASAELASRFTFDDPRLLLWRDWQIWPRYTYLVPIHDLKNQWDKVEQNLRRLVSRCEKEGMTLEPSDDADAFYSMNESTYRRKGAHPYLSRQQFLSLHRELSRRNACHIYFATTAAGKRAAGQVVLMSKHSVTHTWMAGSDPEFLRSGASAFLRWKAFEDLSRRGYEYNDLTDAMNEPVAKFKGQFGGDLRPSFVLYKTFSSKLRLHTRIENLLAKSANAARRFLRMRSRPVSTSYD
ncbi:MAG: GNAT family N-acetyltransferase [Anaerolineales bacterium]|nr:GNAT family N-acetyltransferase [Anaerolineales bacterium]